jgi:lactoylglutathione lyase
VLHPTDTDADDRAHARHGRTVVYFEVDDVYAAVLELRSAGVEVVQEPSDQPWGERDAMAVDPDGFPVLLTQRRA